MRVFISLELPEEIKKEIAKIQKQLQRAGAKATWVKPEIAHLTLAFLGSVTHKELEIIHMILDEIRARPIRLELGSLGCFPNQERARIVFIEFQGNLKALHFLANQIHQNLKEEKIQFDNKPFVAHVTLGRVRRRHPKPRGVRGSPDTELSSGSGQNLTHVLKGVKPKKLEFLAQEISLNQSILGPSGPKYKRLKTLHLT
jgi:2'-5' RNA ligase